MKGRMHVRISYMCEADGIEGMFSGSSLHEQHIWEVPLQLGSLEKGPCGRRSFFQE